MRAMETGRRTHRRERLLPIAVWREFRYVKKMERTAVRASGILRGPDEHPVLFEEPAAASGITCIGAEGGVVMELVRSEKGVGKHKNKLVRSERRLKNAGE